MQVHEMKMMKKYEMEEHGEEEAAEEEGDVENSMSNLMMKREK